MRSQSSRLAASCVFALFTTSLVSGIAAPALPFPHHGTYATRTLKPIHYTQDQKDGHVRESYDRWKANYLLQAGVEGDGHPRYRVKESRDAGAGTSSESQGYGMNLVVYLAGHDANAQTEFDGLWEFFNDHRSEIDNRLMDHSVSADEAAQPGQDHSSFHGDAQIAFALLLAEKQWGNAGRINYGTQAKSVIAGMKVSEIGPTSHLPLLGDWVLQGTHALYNEKSVRSSDLLPSHFRAFATATGDTSWLTTLSAHQGLADYMLAAFSPRAGLLPDFVVWGSAKKRTGFMPAPANFMNGLTDGLWSRNAAKVPLNLGIDALMTQDDHSTRRSKWVGGAMRTAAKVNPLLLRAGYRLTGKPAPKIKHSSTLYSAPLAVAEMNDICPEGLAWINSTYEVIRNSNEGFEADTVSLLSMIVLTSNWWNP